MDRFWEWMKDQDHLIMIDNEFEDIEDYVIELNVVGFMTRIKHLSKQMLIGYMIQYLYEEHRIIMQEIYNHGVSPDKYVDYVFKKIKSRIEKVGESLRLT